MVQNSRAREHRRWLNEESRKGFLRSIRPSDHDQTLLEAPETDVAHGRMRGPLFSIGEVQRQLVTTRVAVSRRFGVVQTDKTRPCDDLLRSKVNRGFFCWHKLRLDTLDHFFGTAVYLRRRARSTRSCSTSRPRDSKVKGLTDGRGVDYGPEGSPSG